MRNSFKKTLQKEIKTWTNLDIITPLQAEKILNCYQEDEPKNPYLLFSIIGSFFMGIGIISLIAHNWDDFGKIERFSIAVSPLLVAFSLAFYTIKYRFENRVWVEGVGIFWIPSLGSAIAIIGQTYHLGSSMRDFYLTWITLSLPVLFALRSDFVAFLILVFLNAMSFDIYHSNSYDMAILIILSIWLVYYIYRGKYAKSSTPFALLSYCLILTICINLRFFVKELGHIPLIYEYMLLFLSFYYIDFFFFKDLSPAKRAFKVASKLGFAIVGIMFLGYTAHKIALTENSNTIIINILFLLSFAGFVYLLFKKKIDDIFCITLPFFLCFVLYFPEFFWLYNFWFVLTLGYMIYNYALKGERMLANYTLSILCIGAFVKFVTNDFGFIVQGVAFIALGFCFLYMNIFIKKRALR